MACCVAHVVHVVVLVVIIVVVCLHVLVFVIVIVVVVVVVNVMFVSFLLSFFCVHLKTPVLQCLQSIHICLLVFTFFFSVVDVVFVFVTLVVCLGGLHVGSCHVVLCVGENLPHKKRRKRRK